MCYFLLTSELVETLEVSEAFNTSTVLRLQEPGTAPSEPLFTFAGPSVVSYLSCVSFFTSALEADLAGLAAVSGLASACWML